MRNFPTENSIELDPEFLRNPEREGICNPVLTFMSFLIELNM